MFRWIVLLVLAAWAQAGALRAVVFLGDCAACTQAVVNVLKRDPVYHWQVQVTSKKFAQALHHADLLVIPGGNEVIGDTWARLTPADRKAVDQFVRRGGRYLGICLGAYLAGDFTEDGARAGWRWLAGIAEYHGPRRGSFEDGLVKVNWAGVGARWVYFSEGPTFGRKASAAGVQVLARYPNGEIAALIQRVGRGAVGLIGPHPEADSDWYDLARMGDTDGLDADLLHHFLRVLMRQ